MNHFHMRAALRILQVQVRLVCIPRVSEFSAEIISAACQPSGPAHLDLDLDWA